MGIGGSKVNIKLPVEEIIKRLDDCLLPDEKETVLDYLDIIEAKLETVRMFKSTTKKFQENRGAQVVLEIIRGLFSDVNTVRLGISIFKLQTSNTKLIMDFIHYGGLDLIERIKIGYADNDHLAVLLPKLLATILDVGAKGAIAEIVLESASLGLCTKCQEALERAKRIHNMSTAVVEVPRIVDRINRVTMFIENYMNRLDVVLVGLDAVISYCKNADSKSSIRETNIAEIVGLAMKTHSTISEVVWRSALILSIINTYHSSVTRQVLNLHLHDLACTLFPEFQKEPSCQQQILWMLASCLSWPKSRRRVQASKICMAFIKTLMDRRENLIRIERKDRLRPFETVVPLQLRSFLRETKGVVQVYDNVEFEKDTDPHTFYKRRDFSPKPRFGTINTTHFAGGVPGLAPAPGESLIEEEKTVEVVPEWEQFLNSRSQQNRDVTVVVNTISTTVSTMNDPPIAGDMNMNKKGGANKGTTGDKGRQEQTKQKGAVSFSQPPGKVKGGGKIAPW